MSGQPRKEGGEEKEEEEAKGGEQGKEEAGAKGGEGAAEEGGEKEGKEGEERGEEAEKEGGGGAGGQQEEELSKLNAFIRRHFAYNPLESDWVKLMIGLGLMYAGGSLAYGTYLQSIAPPGGGEEPEEGEDAGAKDEEEDFMRRIPGYVPESTSEYANLDSIAAMPDEYDPTVAAMFSPMFGSLIHDGQLLPEDGQYIFFLGRPYLKDQAGKFLAFRPRDHPHPFGTMPLPGVTSRSDLALRRLAWKRENHMRKMGLAYQQYDLMTPGGQPMLMRRMTAEKMLLADPATRPSWVLGGPEMEPCLFEDFARRFAKDECETCGEGGGIRLVVGPAGDTFCASHAGDGKCGPCYSCSRMQCGELELEFGERALCKSCSGDSIVWGDELGELLVTVNAFMSSAGMELPQIYHPETGVAVPDFPVRLVDYIRRPVAIKALTAEKRGFKPISTHEEGLCAVSFNEEPPRGVFRRLGYWLRGEKNYVAAVDDVRVLRGMSYLHTGRTLVHEMTHAWLHLTRCPRISPSLEEGICDFMAYLWLSLQLNDERRRGDAALMLRQMEITTPELDTAKRGLARVRHALRGRSLEKIMHLVYKQSELPVPLRRPGRTRLFEKGGLQLEPAPIVAPPAPPSHQAERAAVLALEAAGGGGDDGSGDGDGSGAAGPALLAGMVAASEQQQQQ